MSPRPENGDFDATGSFNDDDFPRRHTLWDSDAESCEPSAVSRRAADELCHGEPCSAVSQVHETGRWSCESRVDDTDDVDQYYNGPTKHFTDRSKNGLSDALGPNTLAASGPLVEESQPSLAGCRSIQPVTETTMCSTPQIPRSKTDVMSRLPEPLKPSDRECGSGGSEQHCQNKSARAIEVHYSTKIPSVRPQVVAAGVQKFGCRMY